MTSRLYLYNVLLAFVGSITLSSPISGQSLGPYVISSTGHLFQEGSVMLYGSLGEPINSSASTEDVILSQGLLQSLLPEAITADCERQSGQIFFDTCDTGELFFFIEMEDGTIYDPYYAKSIDFNHEEGQVVDFDFVDAGFQSPCSIALQAITITCITDALQTSTSDEVVTEGAVLFPNPTSDVVWLSLIDNPLLSIKSMEVHDMHGRCVIKKVDRPMKELKLDVSQLPEGMYLSRLETSQGTFVNKFIVQR